MRVRRKEKAVMAAGTAKRFKGFMKRFTAAAAAVCCVAAGFSGCGGETLDEAGTVDLDEEKPGDPDEAGTVDLMEGIEANEVAAQRDEVMQNTDEIADFAVRLLQSCVAEDAEEGGNTLVSPMSVLYALAMTANGAEENTLLQMEETFGLSVEELNAYLHEYYKGLASDEKCKVSLANSIWFTQETGFEASADFLQRVADYYGAELYETAFDENARNAINAWVKERTNDMIPEILDRIAEDAIMYLVNAVSFDAEWQKIYQEMQIREGEFHAATGGTEQAEFMHSEENVWLEDENAAGFLKYYAGGKFAFAALLPAQGVSVEEYAAGLTGEGLQKLFDDAQNTAVEAAIPKFTCESDYLMNDILIQLGMSDAFDGELADFTGMGTVSEGENIYIGRVLHKAKIEVDERGTKAGAATVVEMKRETVSVRDEIKTVTLDRPFLYMIIDCETKLPLFIGTVKTVE